jgi:hypothetical protein
LRRQWRRPSLRGLRVIAWVAAALALAMLSRTARADVGDSTCEGPDDCCPKSVVEQLKTPVQVSIGVVFVGFTEIAERAGTWDADYYLYESWRATPGFTPQTEVVNEVSRGGAEFDSTELRNGRCIRSRRIRSKLRSAYNLRMFPFDDQVLRLTLSDDQFPSTQVAYSSAPLLDGLDDGVRGSISGWKLLGDPSFVRESRRFKWEEGAPAYDYADFTVRVRRHVSFHITRYFLPLFLIVAVAFGVFWVHPDDLNSSLAVGVTCMLAAIALQFAEAGTLPEVSYLTLADRVFAICYFALALSIGESIYVNVLTRKDEKDKALRVDRRARVWFPIGLVVATTVAVVRAYTQTG